ncbi:MAG: hypothetical protein NZ958_05385 [Bacteroidia bacterium]|nr:hypothetical protein [Bacteroidia bacterium]MDW8088985.1 hypothetical protein [Bacteroidia bacterium]
MKLGLLAGEQVRSFSPLLFQRVFGVPYELYTPPDLTNLRQAIHERGWIGFNVTFPYKTAIYPLLELRDTEVEATQAVNAVSILPDGRWQGHNTDYKAAHYLLGEIESVYGAWEMAVILGTGGVGRAVAYAHAQLYPEVPILFVSREPTARLVGFSVPHRRISYEACRDYPFPEKVLLVQATPVGMFPAVKAMPPFPLGRVQPSWIVWEMIYNPHPTYFLQAVWQRGARWESGYPFFRKQAEYSLAIWNALWVTHYKRRTPAS